MRLWAKRDGPCTDVRFLRLASGLPSGAVRPSACRSMRSCGNSNAAGLAVADRRTAAEVHPSLPGGSSSSCARRATACRRSRARWLEVHRQRRTGLGWLIDPPGGSGSGLPSRLGRRSAWRARPACPPHPGAVRRVPPGDGPRSCSCPGRGTNDRGQRATRLQVHLRGLPHGAAGQALTPRCASRLARMPDWTAFTLPIGRRLRSRLDGFHAPRLEGRGDRLSRLGAPLPPSDVSGVLDTCGFARTARRERRRGVHVRFVRCCLMHAAFRRSQKASKRPAEDAVSAGARMALAPLTDQCTAGALEARPDGMFAASLDDAGGDAQAPGLGTRDSACACGCGCG